jgi:DedD protein
MLETAGGSRMKFLLDQRVKHRIIGVVVIASLASVFLPAMMKQSNYRFDQSTSVSIRLPPKPTAPQVAVKEEDEMFATIKAPKITLPQVKETAQLPPIIHAESISSAAKASPVLAKPELVTKTAISKVAVAPVNKKPTKVLVSKVNKVQKVVVSSVKKGVYFVQLASFAQQNNAKLLVSRLRNKGFKANYIKSAGKSGSLYKVMVGGSQQRQEALTLQKKLAATVQLNGFIVKTGVS